MGMIIQIKGLVQGFSRLQKAACLAVVLTILAGLLYPLIRVMLENKTASDATTPTASPYVVWQESNSSGNGEYVCPCRRIPNK